MVDIKSTIAQLNDPIQILKQAEDQLLSHWEKVESLAGKDNVLSALRALQKAPTEYTAYLLDDRLKKTLQDSDLLFAIELVQGYLETTKSSLKHAVLTLESLDPDLKNDFKNTQFRGPLPQDYNSKDSKKDLYTVSKWAYNILQQRLADILGNLHLTPAELDIQGLLSHEFCPQPPTGFNPDEFIEYLKETKRVLDVLRRRDESLTASEVDKLTKNWGCAIEFLNNPNKKPSKSDTYKFDIAKSIQIHDLLEANYSELAEVVRASDLLNPAIL